MCVLISSTSAASPISHSKEEFSEILIPWKSVQWEPSCSKRTDRHDAANSRFSQFSGRAYQGNSVRYETFKNTSKSHWQHMKHERLWRSYHMRSQNNCLHRPFPAEQTSFLIDFKVHFINFPLVFVNSLIGTFSDRNVGHSTYRHWQLGNDLARSQCEITATWGRMLSDTELDMVRATRTKVV